MGNINKNYFSVFSLTLLVVTLLVLIAWKGSLPNQEGERLVHKGVERQYTDTESNLGPIFPKRTEKIKPLNPLIEELHQARRNGDEGRMREIEARLKPKQAAKDESAGEITYPTSTTQAHAGEAPYAGQLPPANGGSPIEWGTDIHVRGINSSFQESYPAMATASDGTIYIVWENVNSTSPHNYLQVYYSTDGGDSWSAYGYLENTNFDLMEPSLAIGEGTVDVLIIAYVVMDAVPYIEVMTTPLITGSGWSPTIKTLPYYSFWESYRKPVVWTDSYDWSGWYIYLTAEAAVTSATGNYNVVFWRSIDFGNTYTDPAAVPLGNTDPYTWLDPDGTYGTFNDNIYIACYNATDSTIYTLISYSYGFTWDDTVAVYTLPEVPAHPVDPDIEAATNLNNIQIVCTKSLAGNDNIGQTYSQDGGLTWSYLYSLPGYTSLDEFAPELTANEGGGSWHVTYTSDHHAFYSKRPQDLSTTWQISPDVIDDAQYVSHAFTKKAITSNWTTDEPGIAWADYRDGGLDYDIYFDHNMSGTGLYQGPATGSIAGGVSQNTGNFTDAPQSKIDSRQVMEKLIRFGETPLAPAPADMIAPLAPRGSNRVSDEGPTDAAPTLLTDFAGIPDDQNSAGYTFIPPDPICAAGPDYIMACVNTDFAIFDKSGNKLKEIDATQWFENVLPGLDPGFNEPFGVAYDPQIVYDHFEDRWVMIYIADDNASQSYLLLSVSDDANPFGTWYNYAIPGNQNGSATNTFQNDYPKLGLDAYNFYVTANMFDLGGGGFQYVQLRIIEKSQIYSNPTGPVTWIDFWDLRDPDNLSQRLNTASTVVPAVTFGMPGAEYLVNASPYEPGTFMTIWTVPNPASPTTLTATNVPVTAYGWPPNANQLGGGTPLIDVGGWRVRNAVYRGGELVTAHSVADPTDTYAELHLLKFDVSGAPTVIDDITFGASGFWYYYPAITLDASQNSIVVFSRSGNTEYAGIRYTGVVGGVAQASVQLKAGESNYIKTFGGSRNRWGDYSGICNDPINNDLVWMFAEYAASPANTWGTWWGEVTYGTVNPPPENLVALDGYDSAVPLYWDPPSGFTPLEDGAEKVSPVAGPQNLTDTPRADKKLTTANRAGSTEATLLSYDIYRATTPGGPYTFLANVNRQYFRDLTAVNGTNYYYVVQAVFDTGTSGNSNEATATPVSSGYYLTCGYATAPPTIDGAINSSEWTDATLLDIMVPPATQPVTLYAMNDGNYLYLAVDDPNNTVANDFDQIGIYFDEDHNFEWPAASPSGEGNFWVQWFSSGSLTDYRGISGWWPSNLVYDATVSPAPGVSEGIAFGSGHIQYEVAIDLTASELTALPGAGIGFYLFSYDAASGDYWGVWPDVSIWNAPFSYGTLELASQPTMGPPQDLWAYPGYDGAIPLAWNPPTGHLPLESGRSKINISSTKTEPEGRSAADVAPPVNLPASPDQTLLSYNIYRATSPGGPYSLLASGITRQYYRDETVTNGIPYYYVVTAVYDVGESAYSNESSASAAADGYLIHSHFTNTPPVVDGVISPLEWSIAQVVDITSPGNPTPVTMYVMNDAGFLYVAVDNPGNLTLDDLDQYGIYFDENLDREWPPSAPSEEGNFWLEYLSGVEKTEFRGWYGWWPGNIFVETPVSPAAGVTLGISNAPGHVQFETAIDLTVSKLNVAPGDRFGIFVYSETMPGMIYDGWWPQALANSPFGGDWQLPAVYGDVLLASTGPDWVANLSVADNCANSQNLVFGTAPDATLGYDPQYDQYAPPPPPAGAFDGRFRNAVDDFLKDFRPTNTGTTVWDVHFQPASGCTPVTLSWNTAELPATGYFHLRDAVTGTLVDVDMRTQNSYADILQLGHLQIVYSLQQTFDQDIISGWNLLGVPLEMASYYYLDLYPNAISNTCFGWNGAYFNEDSLELGLGYWLRFPAAETVSLTGNPLSTLNIPLQSGWNMISGGVKNTVALADVSDPGGIIIPGTLYGFNGAYYLSDSIRQGSGYWLRTSGAGTITLNVSRSSATLGKIALDPPQVLQASVLEVKDAGGAAQQLLFNAVLENPEQLLSFSLPPVPPAGSFDARFAGDYRLTTTREALIEIQASRYPLTLRATGLQPEPNRHYEIVEITAEGEAEVHVLKEGKNIQIANPAVQKLRLRVSEEVPRQFAVEQNYPNPFNPVTQIRYDIPEDGQVTVAVYNTLGQRVKTLYSGFQKAGRYTVYWDATNEYGEAVGSGIYFYRIEAGKHSAIRKMILMK
ncbi:MAG: hypothetical protein Kow0037_06510 [Calditrichia bacterium]